jgi:hypothetical protein
VTGARKQAACARIMLVLRTPDGARGIGMDLRQLALQTTTIRVAQTNGRTIHT